jgi:hypothetical protein
MQVKSFQNLLSQSFVAALNSRFSSSLLCIYQVLCKHTISAIIRVLFQIFSAKYSLKQVYRKGIHKKARR